MFFLNTIVKLLKILPLSLKNIVASILAFIAVVTPNRSNIIAKLQLNKMLKLKDNFWLRFKVFRHIIRETLSNLNITENIENDFYQLSVNKPKLLDELLGAESKLVLTAHTGNWELLASLISNKYSPVTTIARSARSKNVQKLLVTQREESKIKTIWRDSESSKESIKELIKAFKNGEIIAALIDQDTRVDSTHVKFMGYDAKTPDSLCKLAKKYNSQIYYCFNAMKSPNHLYLEIEKIDSSLEVKEMLSEYNKALEEFIKRFPEQWVWFHKRWRNQPNTGHLSYDQYINFLKN